jgi:lipase chaperone LimK
MKYVVGISTAFLLIVAYAFHNDITLHSQNDITHNQNPLRGAQTILENMHEEPLDFSHLQTPFSQDSKDTQIAGLIRVNEQGNLIIDTELKAFMDYFLSSVGQVTPEQALQRIRLHLYHALPASAAHQAMDILKNYLAFKEASFDELAQPINAERSQYDAHYRYEKLEQGLQTLYNLRRVHLGEEIAHALFVDDEAYAQYTLANMKSDLDETLSDEERQQIKDLAKSQLPEEMASILNHQEKQAKAMQAYSDLLSQEPSIEALSQFAFEHFDSEHAQAIVSDYERQYAIKRKYNHFAQEKQRIVSQGFDKQTQQHEIDSLALQVFTAEEYSMIQAWQLAEQHK